MHYEPNWNALDKSGRTMLKEKPAPRLFICPGCGTTWRIRARLDGRWYVYSDQCEICDTYWEKIVYAYRFRTVDEISDSVRTFLNGNGSHENSSRDPGQPPLL